MKRIRFKQRCICALSAILAMGMCAFFCLASVSAGTEKRRVRIPCGYNDFLMVDENGHVSGFYARYLSELARVNHWEYTYVKTTWNGAVEMLANGEIDLLYPVNYAEERDEQMDFSSLAIGNAAPGLFALENSEYGYEDFSHYDGARIAVEKGTSGETELQRYANEHHFSYIPVYARSNADAMQLVRDGKADLAVFGAANAFPGGVLVSVLDSNPVYFAVKQGDDELLSELNDGMQQLLKTKPELISDVLRLTLVGNNSGVAAMSDAERALIESGKEIVIGFYEESEPLSYVRSDGSYAGVYIELLSHLSQKTGMKIRLLPIDREENWKELLASGTIDFYMGASDVIVSSDTDLRTTEPFMEYANILVTRNDCVFNRLEKPTLALTYGRANWMHYLTEKLPFPFEVKYYRTTKDCMLAVVNGEVDASLLNHLEFGYQTRNERFSSLIQWSQYRLPTSVSFAAASTVDETLFSMFEKALSLISSDFMTETIDANIGIPYHSYSMADLFYNARYLLLIIGAVLLALVALLLLFARYRRKQRKEREAIREKDRRQLQILAATSYDYSAVYYVDLDADTSEPINQHTGLTKELHVKSKPLWKYSEAMSRFTARHALPAYQDLILRYADPAQVLLEFETRPRFTVRYEITPDARKQRYFEMQFVKVAPNAAGHRMMALGIRCIDDTVNAERERQKELQAALDAANSANEAKTEFLSRMSHDIRTPMNAIIGMTAIASAHTDDPERVRDSLRKIAISSRNLLRLINDVLDMSRIEAGKLHLLAEPINLTSMIAELIEEFDPQIRLHGHTLFWDLKGITHDAVIGDRRRICQAFRNLIDNAIKYTPDGGNIRLTVQETDSDRPGYACYTFAFSDTGIGMTPEQQKLIFEPFRRAENRMTNAMEGTGLGLTITRNIVKLMDGTVSVESEPGKGSTFTVSVPLQLQETQGSASDPVLHEMDPEPEHRFPGKRVLLVDDNELNREIMREILQMKGLQVEEAEDGQSALEKVSASDAFYYDLVLMDVQMPVMNGYDATRAIRQSQRDDVKNLPIIALTANVYAEDVQAALQSGMNAYLAKPIDPSQLNSTLKQFLS